MAGESAYEMARRKREKAERLLADAALWERGADGEAETAKALTVLPPDRWTVLHDVRWPGRQLANIDHVVVGPSGVFVIDSKNWSGRVDVRDGVLRQNGSRREKAVAAVGDSALAVAAAVPGLDPRLVHPVLCLVTPEPFLVYSHEVLVCSTTTLVQELLRRPAVLDVPSARRLFGQLYRTMPSATAPRVNPRQQRQLRQVGPPSQLPVSPRLQKAARAPRARGPRVFRSLAVVAGLAIFVSLLNGPLLGRAIGGLARPSSPTTSQAPPLSLGNAQRFPAATGRPPLQVRPDLFKTVRARDRSTYLYPGNRFVAVRVTITNQGRRAWTSQPGTKASITDDLGVPRQSEYLSTTAGHTLPRTIVLRPGRSLRGWAVFQTSKERPVTALTLTVGPGQPSSSTWTIDRQ